MCAFIFKVGFLQTKYSWVLGHLAGSVSRVGSSWSQVHEFKPCIGCGAPNKQIHTHTQLGLIFLSTPTVETVYFFWLVYLDHSHWKWYWYSRTNTIFITAQSIYSLFSFFLSILFIYLRGGKEERAQREEQREKGKWTSCWAQSPMWGWIPRPWDHDLSQNQESDAQLTKPPRRPSFISFYKDFIFN